MRGPFAVAALGLALSAGAASAQVVDDYYDDDPSYFESAVADYYGMPVGPVPRYLHADELPVVYLLAREARVSPEVVIALREQGWSWLDITYHLGVDPYIYVSRLPRRHYGYWGYRGRDFGYLTDRHIVDYVNLVFWADYHRRPVTQIIIIRQRVPTWGYYARYHAPVVVYVHTPRWYNPPPAPPPGGGKPPTGGGEQEPRRAQPRNAVQEQRSLTRSNIAESVRPTERVLPPTGRTVEPPRTPPPSRPAATPPSRPTQQPRATQPPSRPAPQQPRATPPPSRPTPQQPRATQPSRPTPQQPPAAQHPRTTPPSRPAAQQPRATQPTRPVAQQPRATQPSRPAQQPRATQPSRPVAQPASPSAPASRPAPSRARDRRTESGSGGG